MKVSEYKLNNRYRYMLYFGRRRFCIDGSRSLSKEYREAKEWIEQNCKGRTTITWCQGWFELEEDVLAFKLRWE